MSSATTSTADRELELMLDSVVLVPRPGRAHLALSGEDRQRFLGGLVTCDVRSLEAGAGTYGFFTTGKGRILADVVVRSLEDRLELDLPRVLAAAVAEHLERYRVADRVEIGPVAEEAPWLLAGGGLEERWRDAGQRWPETPWSRATVAGNESGADPPTPFRHELAGAPALSLGGAAAADAAARLLSTDRFGEVPRLGADALERARIAAAVPAFGVDFGQDNLPQESGLEEVAVSYTKGCYLGQEIVARVHYRGRAPRRMVRLAFRDAAALEGGWRTGSWPVRSAAGDELGAATSVARALDGSVVGIALLRQATAGGSSVTVEDWGVAAVEELGGGVADRQDRDPSSPPA